MLCEDKHPKMFSCEVSLESWKGKQAARLPTLRKLQRNVTAECL